LVSAFCWSPRIAPSLRQRLTDPSVEVSAIVLLSDKANLEASTRNISNLDRPRVVYRALSEKAKATQGPLLQTLKQWGVKHKPYWIVNMIVITANVSIIHKIASRTDVSLVEANNEFRVELETLESTDSSIKGTNAIEWNVDWVKAPLAWQAGFRGEGGVVANADTGVFFTHAALRTQYRGNIGNNQYNHNYHWWDAIHQTGSSCGADSQFPCDDNGHGTHTTGTAVGADTATNNLIGVAPEAKWIGCRNMNSNFGTPTTYLECFQFFIAPTDLNGNNHNPDLAPDVIGNSYGCPPNEGCQWDSLLQGVQNVRSAGIFMSVSAGNSGPSCGSVRDPPSPYGEVFSVGALGYQSNTIASYSSRGPVTIDGSNRPKPNIVAPGSTVRSSLRTGGYGSFSGTSMSSPAITGAVVIVWQAKPELKRDVEATERLLESTAVKLSSAACGGDSTRDNVYGFGLLDIQNAIA